MGITYWKNRKTWKNNGKTWGKNRKRWKNMGITYWKNRKTWKNMGKQWVIMIGKLMDFDKQNPENVWTPFRKGLLVMDFSWSCWNVVASKPSLSWPRTGPGLYNILAQECLKIMLYPIVFESGTLYLSVFFEGLPWFTFFLVIFIGFRLAWWWFGVMSFLIFKAWSYIG